MLNAALMQEFVIAESGAGGRMARLLPLAVFLSAPGEIYMFHLCCQNMCFLQNCYWGCVATPTTPGPIPPAGWRCVTRAGSAPPPESSSGGAVGRRTGNRTHRHRHRRQNRTQILRTDQRKVGILRRCQGAELRLVVNNARRVTLRKKRASGTLTKPSLASPSLDCSHS